MTTSEHPIEIVNINHCKMSQFQNLRVAIIEHEVLYDSFTSGLMEKQIVLSDCTLLDQSCIKEVVVWINS